MQSLKKDFASLEAKTQYLVLFTASCVVISKSECVFKCLLPFAFLHLAIICSFLLLTFKNPEVDIFFSLTFMFKDVN